MSSPLTRSRATRLSLLYRLGSVLCVVLAGALWVVGIPGLENPAQLREVSRGVGPTPGDTPDPDQSGDDTGSGVTRLTGPRPDPDAISARMALIDNAPQPPEPEPEPKPDNEGDDGSDDEPTERPGIVVKRVHYLGHIEDGGDGLAFVRFDGGQRIVREGETLIAADPDEPDVELVAVRPRFIVVDDGTGRQRIRLKARTGPSIAVTDGSGEDIESQPRTMADVELSEAELERLSKLPPRQRALQERILKRRKLGRPIERQRLRDKEPVGRVNTSIRGNRATRVERAREERASQRDRD